ncbi:sugar kinase [Nocardioides sp.]|uniref:sugar kinase n=1 Tax=Nocardioides sp. TaxID=35761 RepID=UPI0026380528|nr:sugar kinase [Nocardioides sp.]MCW2739050.1 PfkB-family carbohydrate kinase [Nocardioides sp.]
MILSHARDDVDVVAVGETMATFVPDGTPDRYRVVPAGAESNVAIGVAHLGLRARWVSRLGADDLGRLVCDTVSSHGVDVRVEWDEHLPTGIMTKSVEDGRTRVQYYRSGSAASRLDERHHAFVGDRPRWTHLTGITPALSSGARRLASRLLLDRDKDQGQGRTSFDFNYRPALWSGPSEAVDVLAPLARAADLVFVGDDEAAALFGTCDEDALRAELLTRSDQELILKRGGGMASLITTEASWSEPAKRVEVVDLTGAGDAFAAGYLAGRCKGWNVAQRLQSGHFLASQVISRLSDVGPIPDPDFDDGHQSDLSAKGDTK